MEEKAVDLSAVFEEQIRLNERINPALYQEILDPDIRRERFLQFELALRQECAEAVDSLAWKWWKKGEDNWPNIKVELVDILHFWVSMCTVAGLTASEVLDLYLKKNHLNHHRQDQGYQEGTYQKVKDGIEDNEIYVLGSHETHA